MTNKDYVYDPENILKSLTLYDDDYDSCSLNNKLKNITRAVIKDLWGFGIIEKYKTRT